jgi:hypothetical protein
VAGKGLLKPAAAAVALAIALAAISTITSPSGAAAVATAPSKPTVAITAKARAVGKAAHLTKNQVRNAHTIVSIAVARKLPKRAAVIAVATAMQESSLRNLSYGDRDSRGLFQQRPSMGWGTRAQVVDPQYSTRKFLKELQRVPRWRTRPLAQAAQAVQRSAFPNAYARWEPMAQKLSDAMIRPPRPAKKTSAPTKVVPLNTTLPSAGGRRSRQAA